jgi:hypothetical protein
MSDQDTLDLPGREVATTGGDPYAAYGAKVGTTGQFMSFSRVGEFEAGQDKEQVPFGTRVVANMPGLRVGWRRWFGKQVTDDLTELLTDGQPIARRDTLGDMDQALWERDEKGIPRDPWQVSNILELSDGETNYIFSTSSKGGIGAIGRLCIAYAKERRMYPGMLPIITLNRDSYPHKTYGKTYFPVFEIVGWTDADSPSVEDAGGEDTGELPDGERHSQGQRAANPTQAADNQPAASASPTTKSLSNALETARMTPAGRAAHRPTRF